jgi:hypothetical protein
MKPRKPPVFYLRRILQILEWLKRNEQAKRLHRTK